MTKEKRIKVDKCFNRTIHVQAEKQFSSSESKNI